MYDVVALGRKVVTAAILTSIPKLIFVRVVKMMSFQLLLGLMRL